MKEFEWFEWFEWFGPSPIEPFNSGANPAAAVPCGDVGPAGIVADGIPGGPVAPCGETPRGPIPGGAGPAACGRKASTPARCMAPGKLHAAAEGGAAKAGCVPKWPGALAAKPAGADTPSEGAGAKPRVYDPGDPGPNFPPTDGTAFAPKDPWAGMPKE